MLGRPMRGIIQKRCNPGDESELNAIEIKFSVVRKAIQPENKTHREIVCQSRILDDGVFCFSNRPRPRGRLGIEVVAKGWTDGRRKEASGEIKEKDASGGSFARTTRKRPRTQDDDDWGNKLAPMG